MNIKSIKLITAISTIGLLTACAGGGGGGGSSSSSSGGSSSYWATSDVRAAWAEGYTGKGVGVNNIDYAGHGSHPNDTSAIISAIAPDATVVNSTIGTSPNDWSSAMMGAIAGSNTRVVNLSIGFGTTTTSTPSFDSRSTNAVVTKAAGNLGNSVSADQEYTNKQLWNSNMQGNTIYVGAIDPKTGNIASYSTVAGGYSSRFVVADGAGSGSSGTSYSAPVVAGYAALITQKFPNSTGAQIAQAILDTAIMKPGWDPAVYGRGQANLAGALSPQGKLK